MNRPEDASLFTRKIDAIEDALNDYVEHGTDHELFLSGYLHGHFSLVVSQADLHNETCVDGLDKRMRKSLEDAFAQGELEQADQQQVASMWQTLLEAPQDL